LLSATELTIESRIRSIEELPLAYFNARMKLPVGSRFLQTYEDGTTGSYWLRSTYLADDVQASVVWGNGKYGGTGVNYELSVQPALCLSGDTRLVKTELHGKHVYVVCEEIDSHYQKPTKRLMSNKAKSSDMSVIQGHYLKARTYISR
jgi:hypothetical protein